MLPGPTLSRAQNRGTPERGSVTACPPGPPSSSGSRATLHPGVVSTSGQCHPQAGVTLGWCHSLGQCRPQVGITTGWCQPLAGVAPRLVSSPGWCHHQAGINPGQHHPMTNVTPGQSHPWAGVNPRMAITPVASVTRGWHHPWPVSPLVLCHTLGWHHLPGPVSLPGWHHLWPVSPLGWCHAPGWHHPQGSVTSLAGVTLGDRGSPRVLVPQEGTLPGSVDSSMGWDSGTQQGAHPSVSGTCLGSSAGHQPSPVKLVSHPSCWQHPLVLAATLKRGPRASSQPAASPGEEPWGGRDGAKARWQTSRVTLGWGGQFLNMSHSSFSMGVLPMVRRKKSSSTRSEEMKRSAGRSSSSFPNLGGRAVAMGRFPSPGVTHGDVGTAVPDGLPGVVRTVVLAQHHL